MKIVITGGSGQLGSDLVLAFAAAGHQVVAPTRQEMDICRLEEVRSVLHRERPDVVIHSAAYTAVDAAETDEVRAYQVNGVGTRNVAVAAEEVGAKLCYVSTDYVFDGTASVPYREYDNTNPLGVYGRSKRAGEQLVQTLSSRYFIVRTSWVFGVHGPNFVKTMLKLAAERSELTVVADQIGSPTYTVDLATFLLQLVATDYFGIYHATNGGHCSWHEFARAIFAESGLSVTVHPCTTEEFPRPAPRPNYSVMEPLAIRANGLTELRPWREALRAFLNQLHA